MMYGLMADAPQEGANDVAKELQETQRMERKCLSKKRNLLTSGLAKK